MTTQRTTHILLTIVAVLLFAIVLKLYDGDIVSVASAQTARVESVRIVGCNVQYGGGCDWRYVAVDTNGQLRLSGAR